MATQSLLLLLCVSQIWLGHSAPQIKWSAQSVRGNQDDTAMNDFQMVDLCETVSDQHKKENCSKCFMEVADPEKDTAEVAKCTSYLPAKVASCVKKVIEATDGKKYEKCNTAGTQEALTKEDGPELTQTASEDDHEESTVQEVMETTEESVKQDESNNSTKPENYSAESCWAEYGSMAALNGFLSHLEQNDRTGFQKVMSVIESCLNVSKASETLDTQNTEAMENDNKQTKSPSDSEKEDSEKTSETPNSKEGKKAKTPQGHAKTPSSSEDSKKSQTRRRRDEDEPSVEQDEDDKETQNTNGTDCVTSALLGDKESLAIIKSFVAVAEIPIPASVVKALVSSFNSSQR